MSVCVCVWAMLPDSNKMMMITRIRIPTAGVAFGPAPVRVFIVLELLMNLMRSLCC